MPSGQWFPGTGPSMLWDCTGDDFDEITSTVADIRTEQGRFDGSVLSVMLIESLLATLLVRLLRQPTGQTRGDFPGAFLQFSQLVEDNFRTRPTIAWFAQELGYSTRTLDRVCHTALGRSAKAVLDDRVNLDISRLLTDTDTPIKQISAAFGFTDPASFSKYVDRHLGSPPTHIRQQTRR
ncbi:MAG: helix-turn-helix domain-containing protein [Acidimicrobiales bacterium]